jgi:hypothetical protein
MLTSRAARCETPTLACILDSRSRLDSDFPGTLGKSPTANQIEFINVIIDHLIDQGYMDTSLLYGSPFIDFSPRGVDGLFASDQVMAIFSILDGIRQTAVA